MFERFFPKSLRECLVINLKKKVVMVRSTIYRHREKNSVKFCASRCYLNKKSTSCCKSFKHGHTAVDKYAGAGNVIRIVGSKEHGKFADIGWNTYSVIRYQRH
jgi:hypothetical protein